MDQLVLKQVRVPEPGFLPEILILEESVRRWEWFRSGAVSRRRQERGSSTAIECNLPVMEKYM